MAEEAEAGGDFMEGLRRRERTVSLPQGVRLKAFWKPGQDSPSLRGLVVFFPRGNSSGGRIVLEGPGKRELWVVVDPWGGRVKITEPQKL